MGLMLIGISLPRVCSSTKHLTLARNCQIEHYIGLCHKDKRSQHYKATLELISQKIRIMALTPRKQTLPQKSPDRRNPRNIMHHNPPDQGRIAISRHGFQRSSASNKEAE